MSYASLNEVSIASGDDQKTESEYFCQLFTDELLVRSTSVKNIYDGSTVLAVKIHFFVK